MSRAEQREETRARIVLAATAAFADQGFEAAGTRAIAAEAGVTQGLLTYHFPTKLALWQAAADHIFELVDTEVVQAQSAAGRADDGAEAARERIRIYVRFAARHPEMFRFMMDAQSDPDGRSAWLVDSYLRPLYEDFVASTEAPLALAHTDVAPHLFYAMVGAGSAIFALSGEVANVAKLDVTDPAVVEVHADVVARLLVP